MVSEVFFHALPRRDAPAMQVGPLDKVYITASLMAKELEPTLVETDLPLKFPQRQRILDSSICATAARNEKKVATFADYNEATVVPRAPTVGSIVTADNLLQSVGTPLNFVLNPELSPPELCGALGAGAVSPPERCGALGVVSSPERERQQCGALGGAGAGEPGCAERSQSPVDEDAHAGVKMAERCSYPGPDPDDAKKKQSGEDSAAFYQRLRKDHGMSRRLARHHVLAAEEAGAAVAAAGGGTAPAVLGSEQSVAGEEPERYCYPGGPDPTEKKSGEDLSAYYQRLREDHGMSKEEAMAFTRGPCPGPDEIASSWSCPTPTRQEPDAIPTPTRSCPDPTWPADRSAPTDRIDQRIFRPKSQPGEGLSAYYQRLRKDHEMSKEEAMALARGHRGGPEAAKAQQAPPDMEEAPSPPEIQEAPSPPDMEEAPSRSPPEIQEAPSPPDMEEAPSPPEIQEAPSPPDMEEALGDPHGGKCLSSEICGYRR